MAPHRLHPPSTLPPPPPRIHLQKTRMALLPLRPLLLHHDPQLHLDLAPAVLSVPLDRVLLSEHGQSGERGDYVEE